MHEGYVFVLILTEIMQTILFSGWMADSLINVEIFGLILAKNMAVATWLLVIQGNYCCQFFVCLTFFNEILMYYFVPVVSFLVGYLPRCLVKFNNPSRRVLMKVRFL